MSPLIAFDKFFVCLHLPESNFVICTKTRVIHWGQPVRGELIIGAGSMMTELSKNPQPGSKSRQGQTVMELTCRKGGLRPTPHPKAVASLDATVA